MPITPFHFGPGAALHALAPRHVSFIAFCAANVLIDFESLYNLVNRRSQVHAFFHTYVGATLVALAVIGIFATLRGLSARVRLPDPLRWKELTYRQVVIGSALGAYSHVALDSLMHRDITPFMPMTTENTPWLGQPQCLALVVRRRWLGGRTGRWHPQASRRREQCGLTPRST